MRNEYLVIKMPWDYIERRRVEEEVIRLVGAINILDGADVITLVASKAILNHSPKEAEKFTKQSIAVDIGRRLLDIGGIQFRESSKGCFATEIEGSITVIREPYKREGGAQ